ncbi:MAG TPA: hypothetical protein VGT99_06560, partial [Gammaproteobacteria bacterium]|nr:hypothetical protein [Gammaproteobacteria bacterium]
DEKYGDREANKRFKAAGLNRMFLHAAELAFDHPESGERLELKAPLDGELEAVLKTLEKG